jgi:xylulokinase
MKGIFRFETGIKVTEFRDLRANPRCLLESQILSFRVKWSRMIATGVTGSGGRGRGNVAQLQVPLPGRSSSVLSSLGLPFDPYDHQPLPARIIATGAAANFPSVANVVGDVFNAPVFLPSTQVDSAQIVPHRNAPAQGYPGRAALGGAYVARWVWGREWGGAGGNGRGLGGFEEEIRRLLGKRWIATGGMPLRTNVNGAVGASASAMGIGGGSGANSGTSTPYGHASSRSGLGTTIFMEEEEEDPEEMERVGGASYLHANVFGGDLNLHLRTHTSSTVDTTTTSLATPSTAYTTPDLNTSPGLGVNGGNLTATTPTTPTPLTPVVAMPTADAEAQIGLAKVAEPDVDAFMTYAAIVPEYCRLEGMVVKGLI